MRNQVVIPFLKQQIMQDLLMETTCVVRTITIRKVLVLQWLYVVSTAMSRLRSLEFSFPENHGATEEEERSKTQWN